jgi:hypothetical protein
MKPNFPHLVSFALRGGGRNLRLSKKPNNATNEATEKFFFSGTKQKFVYKMC